MPFHPLRDACNPCGRGNTQSQANIMKRMLTFVFKLALKMEAETKINKILPFNFKTQVPFLSLFFVFILFIFLLAYIVSTRGIHYGNSIDTYSAL
jgi:hypothetical protein